MRDSRKVSLSRPSIGAQGTGLRRARLEPEPGSGQIAGSAHDSTDQWNPARTDVRNLRLGNGHGRGDRGAGARGLLRHDLGLHLRELLRDVLGLRDLDVAADDLLGLLFHLAGDAVDAARSIVE